MRKPSPRQESNFALQWRFYNSQLCAQAGTLGKICLHMDLLKETGGSLPLKEELFKRKGMTIIFPFLQIFFVLYLTWKAKKFIKGHCPQKKMSSIGRYKRNLMSHMESTIMGLYWNLLALFETHNHIQWSINQLRPDLVFKVESILWIIFSEGSVIIFTFFLSPELKNI